MQSYKIAVVEVVGVTKSTKWYREKIFSVDTLLVEQFIHLKPLFNFMESLSFLRRFLEGSESMARDGHISKPLRAKVHLSQKRYR